MFASELKAIRAVPGFAAEVDRNAVAGLAARAYVPAPLSIYRGIFKLLPGTILSLVRGAAPRQHPVAVGSHGEGVSCTPY